MTKRGRSGDPARHRYWRDLVERWRLSGQSVREFCRTAGVKESAFYWWKRRLGRCRPRQGGHRATPGSLPCRPRAMVPAGEPGRAGRTAARFLPIEVAMDGTLEAAGSVEIVVGGGRRIRVQPGFDRQTLGEVLAALEGRPC
jgi:hypothetical protein